MEWGRYLAKDRRVPGAVLIHAWAVSYRRRHHGDLPARDVAVKGGEGQSLAVVHAVAAYRRQRPPVSLGVRTVGEVLNGFREDSPASSGDEDLGGPVGSIAVVGGHSPVPFIGFLAQSSTGL